MIKIHIIAKVLNDHPENNPKVEYVDSDGDYVGGQDFNSLVEARAYVEHLWARFSRLGKTVQIVDDFKDPELPWLNKL